MSSMIDVFLDLEEQMIKDGFRDCDEEFARQMARRHTNDVVPLTIFIEWLKRCPEAEEYLEDKLLSGKTARKSESGNQQPKTIRVLLNGKEREALVTGFSGDMIKVQSVENYGMA